MEEKDQLVSLTCPTQTVAISLEELLSQKSGVSIRFCGQTLFELHMEDVNEQRRPVLTFNAPELEIRLRVGRLSIESGDSSIELSQREIVVTSTGLLQLTGEKQLDLWGGKAAPDRRQASTLEEVERPISVGEGDPQ